MSKTAKAYDELSAAVGASKLSDELANAPVVAVLHGPKEAIECIVQKASRESKIPMDWGYSGGRAFIHAKGDREKARSALYCAMPGGDLTQADM